MTIPEFAMLFSGRLAEYGHYFVLAADNPAPVPGTALADKVFLAGQISRFADAHYPGGDRRAVVSLWSKAHFATMLPPFMALSLVLQRSVNVELSSIGCTFWADGTLRHIHLPDTGRLCTGIDPQARFGALLDGHLAPLIGALASVGGLAARVLWSNAGNTFEHTVRKGEALLGSNRAITDSLSLLQQRRFPDGRLNPLYAPVSYGDCGVRRRRLCCIRYLIDGLGYCSACPLPAGAGEG